MLALFGEKVKNFIMKSASSAFEYFFQNIFWNFHSHNNKVYVSHSSSNFLFPCPNLNILNSHTVLLHPYSSALFTRNGNGQVIPLMKIFILQNQQ